MEAFYPSVGKNQVVNPASTSDSVAIEKGTRSVRFVNSGSNICYVRVGVGEQTATTGDIPVRSAESVIIGKGTEDDTCAYISASGTTLNIQPGIGGV